MNVYLCGASHGVKAEVELIERLIYDLGLRTWTFESSIIGTVDRNAYQAAAIEMEKADIFIGLFADIYGWIPEKDWYGENTTDGEISFPHMEYLWATKRKIPRLMFFPAKYDNLGAEIKMPEDRQEHDPVRSQKITELKRQILKTDYVQYYHSLENLKKLAGASLIRTTHLGNLPNRNMVFISHSTHDDEFVSKLAEKLQQAGISPWVDHKHMRPGADWDTVLEQALNASDALLIVVSEHSNRSLVVKAEWSYFGESGKKVYPILLNSGEVPFRLRVVQNIDFRVNPDRAFAQLLEVLSVSTNTINWTDS